MIILIVLNWILVIRATGLISLGSALLLGLTAYSAPVLLGYYLHFGSSGLAETQVSHAATNIMIWAWFWVLLATIVFYARPANYPRYSFTVGEASALNMYDSRSRLFCLLSLAVSVSLYLWIAILDSPLYFLDDRQVIDVQAERQKLLWKWVNLYGLISAMLIRSKAMVCIFCIFIMIYFLAGDRTMVLISGVSVAVYFLQGVRSIRQIIRPDLFLLVGLVLVLILFGKPIYYAVKSQSVIPMQILFAPNNNSVLLSFFEPLLIHNLFEDVIRSGFTYSWLDLGKGVIGQLLIVPSEFGIDSSAFNAQLQQALYPRVRFGVANHYFAQAWSLGSWSGVALFAFSLVLAIRLLGDLAFAVSPLPRIMIVIMGVVVGTYFFRNSVENILSMLRQIFLVGAVLLMATQLWAVKSSRASSFRARLAS